MFNGCIVDEGRRIIKDVRIRYATEKGVDRVNEVLLTDRGRDPNLGLTERCWPRKSKGPVLQTLLSLRLPYPSTPSRYTLGSTKSSPTTNLYGRDLQLPLRESGPL